MTPEEPEFDISDTSISRRRMLKRMGAGAAVAWSAPVLTSLSTPAFAATPTCDQCAGEFCAGQTQCGDQPPFGCFCAQIVGSEPTCFCYHDNVCTERTPCPNGQGDCPSGQTCVHTCCDDVVGSPVCFGPCGESGSQGRVRSGARGGSR